MSTPDPITSIRIASFALKLGNIFGGLFEDKDYPWARVDVWIDNGVAKVLRVQTLDGQDRATWNALGNELVVEMRAAINRLPVAQRRQLRLGAISIGFASGRGGSQLGSGWYISDNTPGFADTPLFKNVRGVAAATQIFFGLANERLGGMPTGVSLFAGKTPHPTTPHPNHEAFAGPLNNLNLSAVGRITQTQNRLATVISNTANQERDLLADVTDTISSVLSVALLDNSRVLNESLGTITSFVDTSLSNSQRLNDSLLGQLGDGLDLFLRAQSLFQDDLQATLDIDISGFVDKAISVLSVIEGIHAFSIENILDSVEVVLRGQLAVFTDAIDDVLGLADSLTGLVSDINIPDFIPSLETIGERIGGIAPAAVAARLMGAPDFVGAAAKGISDVIRQDPDEANALEKFFFEAADLFQLDFNVCKDRFDRADDPENLGDNFIRLVANMISALLFPLLIAQARAQGCLQQWAQQNPYLMMAPAESAVAMFRDLISPDAAIKNVMGVGFQAEDAEKIIETVRPLPEETILLSMWLREILDDAQSDKAFKGKGWTDEWTARFKEIAFFIPPAQDLITMAVREVFTKEISEAFGQFDDFPPDFGKWAKRQGISEEWAQNYWAAHWALPSIQMGFEMLHRRVIDEPKLKQLMQALDIMPGWRDDLIKISFIPFTRIDIRRMNRVGVLSSEDVFQAYLDLGYNETNARKLQEFVKELNEPEETLAEQLADELTRSNILGFYADGIINGFIARTLLRNAGYSVLSIELFIDDVDFKTERSDRKADIKIVTEQLKSGVLDFGEAQARLDGLGLETRERDLALLQLQRVQAANIKTPSRGDLDNFVKKKIISEAVYRGSMERLGFQEFWIDKYLQLATAG